MLCRFGTFSIRTPSPLPALLPAASQACGRTVDLGWADTCVPADIVWSHHWIDGEEITLSLARQGADYWLRSPGVADFLLRMQPCRILVSPEPHADADTLEHILLDQVLPRVLAQHGELMVHASALAISGRHALFMGPSGWGKSTLAGLFRSREHAVLSDDCVQLIPHAGRCQAIPTYPSLRLHADSLEALLPDATTTPVAYYSGKQRVAVDAPAADGTFPVDAIYLLGDPGEATEVIRIDPLHPAETCGALLRHTFRLDLADHAANAHQFALCGAVAREVPAFRLHYPRDFARSDALARDIIRHLTSLPAKD